MTLSAFFGAQYYITIDGDGLSTSQTVIVESPHPYPNNHNNTWTLTRSGALRMKCHFAYIHTESNFDCVYILDGAENVCSVYTGDFDDVWSVWVRGDTIKIRLTSDSSIVDDGFVIDWAEWQNQSATATIDSVNYELPRSFWWDSDSSHCVNVPSTIDDHELPGKRYSFTEWSGLLSSTSNNMTFTVSEPGILTANYKTQYYLTINTDPSGLTPQPEVSPSGLWYDNGTTVTCTAQMVSGYTFDYWTVDKTSQGQGINPITIIVNEPHTAIAHYSAHDIATTNVTPSKTVIGQNYSLSIYVTAENQGDYTETFNITLYANTTIVETKGVTLTSRNSTTITFTWNTTGFALGNYTISAIADTVLGETDTTDNNSTDGWVTVTILGDVNGDFKCDGKDIARIAKAYGSLIGQPAYVRNADINDDGKIDGKDIAVSAKYFGTRYP
jgi:hypothetical protein